MAEPESIYQTPNHPQRRIRQPEPNLRTPAYNAYNNEDTNRQSGFGALGEGFMNGFMDDDDDDDEKEKKYNPFTTAKEKESKHDLLARSLTPSPPPQYQRNANAAIASPKPGYAAPIEALSRPDAAAVPLPRQPLSINTSNNPFASPMDRVNMPLPPQPVAVPSTPHPLQPPMTPITPVFARPRQQDIHFDEKPIMRAAREGTTLPSRGEKGDDFWRRFSMVVKEEDKKPSGLKTSAWLKTTQGRTKSMFRWVFVVGLILTVCVLGAIGLWYYTAHNSNSHDQPATIGGSAKESGVAGVGQVTSSVALGTSLHVSPSTTVARRLAEPHPTAAFHKMHLNRHHQ